MDLTVDAVRLQLARLKRHHALVVATADEVALLDLCHALRVWADMKGSLSKVFPAAASTLAFKTATPAKPLKNYVRGYGHVIAFMPGGVVTRADRGLVMGVDTSPDGKAFAGADFEFVCHAPIVDGHPNLQQAVLAIRKCDDSMKPHGPPDIARCNFQNWMGAEVVRVALPGDPATATTISREMLIRRVANTLGASHPVGDSDAKQIDAQIALMMRVRCAGLTLPYFLILKVAQDLLAVAPKWIPRPRSAA